MGQAYTEDVTDFELAEIRSYHDIKKIVSKEAFLATMTYVAWHNRLTMTPILTVWQAVVLALYYENHPADSLLYNAIKSFWDGTYEANIRTNTQCESFRSKLEAHVHA